MKDLIERKPSASARRTRVATARKMWENRYSRALREYQRREGRVYVFHVSSPGQYEGFDLPLGSELHLFWNDDLPFSGTEVPGITGVGDVDWRIYEGLPPVDQERTVYIDPRTVLAFLAFYGACSGSVEWFMSQWRSGKTVSEAWDNCPHVEWLSWIAVNSGAYAEKWCGHQGDPVRGCFTCASVNDDPEALRRATSYDLVAQSIIAKYDVAWKAIKAFERSPHDRAGDTQG